MRLPRRPDPLHEVPRAQGQHGPSREPSRGNSFAKIATEESGSGKLPFGPEIAFAFSYLPRHVGARLLEENVASEVVAFLEEHGPRLKELIGRQELTS